MFDLEDKPGVRNYPHAGLDLSTDFRGRSAFNLKVSHNRHWLTRNGTEWRKPPADRRGAGSSPSCTAR
ncbi:MAG: hypothetical protein IPP44_12375 [Ideonella sp.]|nr:hypothetical protein [Ideonella sp.]